MIFDWSYPDIETEDFQEHDWKHFYGNVHKVLPPNVPKALEKDGDLHLYVDSDHTMDKNTRHSRTRLFVYLNSALVTWQSKKQPTIETMEFGAEFVAMKNGIKTVHGLRYKLWMMGVEISGPTFVRAAHVYCELILIMGH